MKSCNSSLPDPCQRGPKINVGTWPWLFSQRLCTECNLDFVSTVVVAIIKIKLSLITTKLITESKLIYFIYVRNNCSCFMFTYLPVVNDISVLNTENNTNFMYFGSTPSFQIYIRLALQPVSKINKSKFTCSVKISV